MSAGNNPGKITFAQRFRPETAPAKATDGQKITPAKAQSMNNLYMLKRLQWILVMIFSGAAALGALPCKMLSKVY